MHSQNSDSETDDSIASSAKENFRADPNLHFQINQSPTKKAVLFSAQNNDLNDSCFNDSDGENEESLLTVRGIDSITNGDNGMDKPLELQLIPKRSHSTVSRVNDETDHWGADELAAQEEFSLSLSDPSLKGTLMSRLNTFRRNRELCDIVLFVNEREILAHKLVLAAISPALFDMFLNDSETGVSTPTSSTTNTNNPLINGAIKEKSVNPIQPSPVSAGITTKQLAFFEFAQGDFECFEAIVNFAYTSKLQIGSKKVAELYKTAYCLQVFPVANACARYLAEHLSFNNCIGIRKQANFNNDAFLVDKVDSFIGKNFDRVIADSLEFAQLPRLKVRIIVEEVQKDEHTGVFLGDKALQYFQKNPRLMERLDQQKDNEKSYLLFLNTEEDLQDCCDMDDQSSVGSCEIVQDYKRSGKNVKHSAKNTKGVQPIQHRVTGAMAVKMNASRVSNAKYASNESLNSMASSASTVDEIESRLIAVNKTSSGFWTALAVLFRRLTVFSIQLSENEDFIIRNGIQCPLKQNGIIDPKTESLSSTPRPMETIEENNTTISTTNGHPYDTHQVNDLPPPKHPQMSGLNELNNNSNKKKAVLKSMNQARCAIGAVFVSGQIIVFGGYDRGECLSSAEAYDIQRELWRPLPSMSTERGRFGSAVIQNKVYAIAGSNGNNDLKSCECYDTQLEQWSPIRSLAKARSHNGCATIESSIYCIGGSSDQAALKECERYDAEQDVWERISPMTTARFQAGCTAWRGLIIACGGTDKWQCLDSVEAYDPKTDSWRTLNKLTTPRRGCAVAVIRECLYVIGGHDGTQSLASVEVLDSPNGNWRPGPTLSTPRANTHAVVTASHSIYVIGGFNNGNQFLSTIEVLENETLGWRNWQTNPSNAVIPEEGEGIGKV